MKKRNPFFVPMKNLNAQMRKDRKSFIIVTVLRVLVVFVMIRSFLSGQFEDVAICALALLMFLIPAFLETKLRLEIPTLFESIVYLFIFAAWILGEINDYYVLIPGWDTMLHTLNGFLCAAVGFSLVDLLNRGSSRVNLTPASLTVVSFCFSMTVGVLWEFVECAMDLSFGLDMQKDAIVQSFNSVTLDPLGQGNAVHVGNITSTVITTSSGATFTIEGGYLDIGLLDTMKDLFVNFVGAVIFNIFAYIYLTKRDKKNIQRIGEGLIVRPVDGDGDAAQSARSRSAEGSRAARSARTSGERPPDRGKS